MLGKGDQNCLVIKSSGRKLSLRNNAMKNMAQMLCISQTDGRTVKITIDNNDVIKFPIPTSIFGAKSLFG